MSVLNDPRVYAGRAIEGMRGNAYLIEGGPICYKVAEVPAGWCAKGTNRLRAPGWVVFGDCGVWLGSVGHFALSGKEVDAKGVYSTAEAAVAAVLAGLDCQ